MADECSRISDGGKTDINITLDKNIDLTGKGWTPIGTSFKNSYTGTFDGGGHTITGLTVTTNDKYAGLFGYIGNAGTVKNVVMEGVLITSNNGSSQAGGVAGFSRGTIENCSVSGSVSGTVYVGGVVGAQWSGSITGCSSSATDEGNGRCRRRGRSDEFECHHDRLLCHRQRDLRNSLPK